MSHNLRTQFYETITGYNNRPLHRMTDKLSKEYVKFDTSEDPILYLYIKVQNSLQ